MPETRKAMHVYLSDSAHDTWKKVANDNGVSLSGLVEALAIDVLDDPKDRTPVQFALEATVKTARKIDSARRAR